MKTKKPATLAAAVAQVTQISGELKTAIAKAHKARLSAREAKKKVKHVRRSAKAARKTARLLKKSVRQLEEAYRKARRAAERLAKQEKKGKPKKAKTIAPAPKTRKLSTRTARPRSKPWPATRVQPAIGSGTAPQPPVSVAGPISDSPAPVL
jgi:hypothetical protein